MYDLKHKELLEDSTLLPITDVIIYLFQKTESKHFNGL